MRVAMSTSVMNYNDESYQCQQFFKSKMYGLKEIALVLLKLVVLLFN